MMTLNYLKAARIEINKRKTGAGILGVTGFKTAKPGKRFNTDTAGFWQI